MKEKASSNFRQALLIGAILVNAFFGFGQTSRPQGGSLEKQLTDHELALVQAEKHHDNAAFNRLLDDRLIYVAFNGWVFTKKDVISKMHYIDVEKYDPENIKVRLPSRDTALITYDLKAKASIAGHGIPKSQYVSSLWVRKGDQWQLLFHQATPATHP